MSHITGFKSVTFICCIYFVNIRGKSNSGNTSFVKQFVEDVKCQILIIRLVNKEHSIKYLLYSCCLSYNIIILLSILHIILLHVIYYMYYTQYNECEFGKSMTLGGLRYFPVFVTIPLMLFIPVYLR